MEPVVLKDFGILLNETAIILKNLEAAKAFCMEFYNKRDELIQDAI